MKKPNKFYNKLFIGGTTSLVLGLLLAVLLGRNKLCLLFDFYSELSSKVILRDLSALILICLIVFIPVIIGLELLQRWKDKYQ